MQVWLLGFKQEQISYLYVFCLFVLHAYMYAHTELHPTEFSTLISTSNVHLSSLTFVWLHFGMASVLSVNSALDFFLRV